MKYIFKAIHLCKEKEEEDKKKLYQYCFIFNLIFQQNGPEPTRKDIEEHGGK